MKLTLAFAVPTIVLPSASRLRYSPQEYRLGWAGRVIMENLQHGLWQKNEIGYA